MPQNITYKPYTIKEYKELHSNIVSNKLGGLGANTGSEDWKIAKQK